MVYTAAGDQEHTYNEYKKEGEREPLILVHFLFHSLCAPGVIVKDIYTLIMTKPHSQPVTDE